MLAKADDLFPKTTSPTPKIEEPTHVFPVQVRGTRRENVWRDLVHLIGSLAFGIQT